jgi:hypothetical protein
VTRPDAVQVVARKAKERRSEARARLARVVGERDTDEVVAKWQATLRDVGRLTLNFHPDRNTARGVTVAEGLLDTGRYCSQFETGASNGSRSAVRGGERDEWEHLLFDDVYRDVDDTVARPVYGAFDLLRDPHGGSPRFGSSYVVLQPHVIDRATFCVGDSHQSPSDVGTMDEPLNILAGLYEQAAAGVLLERAMGIDVLDELVSNRFSPRRAARVLDGYVEAQIHGGVELGRDVRGIVVDPSFRNTPTEDSLSMAAQRHGFQIEWHEGSELDVTDVPGDFRGPTMPALARRVAGADGVLDAAAIGTAARRVPFTPPTPGGDRPESELQQLKYLWHVLLAHGRDRASGGGSRGTFRG